MKKQKALDLLFHPESYPGMSIRAVSEIELLLWRNNSLGEYTAWALIQSGKDCLVRRIIWNQRSTYNLNEPEIYCADAITSIEEFNRILGTLHDSLNNVTVNAPPTITVDGVWSGVLYQKRRIEWWGQPEDNLDELSQWHDNAVVHLDALFNW